MPQPIYERVWDDDYHGSLHVTEKTHYVDRDLPGDLEIMVDEGGDDGAAATITLTPAAAKKLRLALARYERNQKA